MASREIDGGRSSDRELRSRLDAYLRLAGLDARTRALWVEEALRERGPVEAFARVLGWLGQTGRPESPASRMQAAKPVFLWSPPPARSAAERTRMPQSLLWSTIFGTLALLFAISR